MSNIKKYIGVRYDRKRTLVSVYDKHFKSKRHTGKNRKIIARYSLSNHNFKILKCYRGELSYPKQEYMDLVSEFLGYNIEFKPKKRPRKEVYKEYLSSPEWQGIRAKKIEEADGRCQICYSDKKLNIHHRTYIRIFKEELSDLTVLCKSCHEKFHDIKNQNVARGLS